jgi:pseudouridine-5'-phosphate glycosidase
MGTSVTSLCLVGKTRVGVVCAGVKSILDIPRTLEVLETQGVLVATVGTDLEFPAFFSRRCVLCLVEDK